MVVGYAGHDNSNSFGSSLPVFWAQREYMKVGLDVSFGGRQDWEGRRQEARGLDEASRWILNTCLQECNSKSLYSYTPQVSHRFLIAEGQDQTQSRQIKTCSGLSDTGARLPKVICLFLTSYRSTGTLFSHFGSGADTMGHSWGPSTRTMGLSIIPWKTMNEPACKSSCPFQHWTSASYTSSNCNRQPLIEGEWVTTEAARRQQRQSLHSATNRTLQYNVWTLTFTLALLGSSVLYVAWCSSISRILLLPYNCTIVISALHSSQTVGYDRC
jgi:hypothetical protein